MEANAIPAEPSTEAPATGPGTPPDDSREYKVKFVETSFMPRHGLTGGGTLAVQSGMVRLSGLSRKGFLLIALLFPFVIGFNDNFAGMLFGFKLKIIPLLVIFAALYLILHYRCNYFMKSSAYEKERIRNVVRNRRVVSFDVSEAIGKDERPMKVTIKARNEEEAALIEEQLRTWP